MTCIETQAKLTRGDALDESERDHALICPECGAVAASATLDATLAELDAEVPEGFADRVMANIAREVAAQSGNLAPAGRPPWYERRWGGVLLASAAALVAMVNVARFVVSVLVPAGSFGGAP